MSGYGAEDAHSDEPEPVIRDRRRVDPVTGQVRDPGFGGSPSPFPGRHAASDPSNPNDPVPPLRVDLSAAELDLARQEAAERMADLQRITAEYANYRKRVDRDRDLVREQSTAAVLAELLTVLDDIDRAKEHGEVVGGFKAVADSLETSVSKLGLEKFGEPGDPFDPTFHEALTHSVSEEVAETTCVQVFQPGYRYAGRLIRPARVAVADPAP